MLSFIIIGRNEGWKLTKCIKSVINTIIENKLTKYEIIYVDSKSTDDSIERAKQFNEVKLFQLTKDYNAAIARNVGVNESSGSLLFFIDGDMEVIPSAFSFFYTEEKGLVYPFVSGNWVNYFYNQDWKYLSKETGLDLMEDINISTVGGNFFIEKDWWLNSGGMKIKFKRSQDIDLALRLAKQGIQLLRKKELLVHHHMISYFDNYRKWKLLFSGADLYGRSYLYRKNIFNKYCWKRIIRNDYSVLILLLSIVLSVLLNSFIPLISFIFILLPKTIRKKGNYLGNYFYFLLRDVFVLLGYFLFWPKKLKNISYSEIKYLK